MGHLISVELDSELAKRLVADPSSWDYDDKDELLQAIETALEVDDVFS